MGCHPRGATVVPVGDGHRMKEREGVHREWPSRGHEGGPARWASRRWREGCAGSRSVEAGEGLADAEDEFAVDELLLPARSVAESGAGEAVDLAQGALRKLVESGEGIVGEEVAFAPGVVEAEADVLGGVVTVAGASRKR